METESSLTRFIHRDLSWLSFNERVLLEAGMKRVPLAERFKFLAIYSSNLDEFYRVRMPTLMALLEHSPDRNSEDYQILMDKIKSIILDQLKLFGEIIENEVVSELRKHKVHLLYNEPVPEFLKEYISGYFINTIAAYLRVVDLEHNPNFFPENNKLYLLVTTLNKAKSTGLYILNVPSDILPRFLSVTYQGKQYILFLEDVIKQHLSKIFVTEKVKSCHAIKITRNAELNLEDEFEGNLAKKIERKLRQRDQGAATRLLYEPGISKNTLQNLADKLNLKGASLIAGGAYHNLRDFSDLPLKDPKLHYEKWPPLGPVVSNNRSLFDEISTRDILIHPPYYSYDIVLRFFNEAAIDSTVQRIYITLYRVAADSRIANALMSAAQNGKKVTVFVELKARFDEANNIRWMKRMKEEGIRIIESIPGLKVHAKLALVKRKRGKKNQLIGLLSTGNFNESTARYYTDHILMTAHRPMLKEAERLFKILKKKRKKLDPGKPNFEHLLVGQFNLQPGFVKLIDAEIANARKGLPASIIIKLNNMEEQGMINTLYEASQAGVQVSLIVRGICCLRPGVKGLSENISARRIVDRYLEHGRVFIFNNNNNPLVFLGSADWMIRNIHRRIEVCFPVYQEDLKKQLIYIVTIQLQDNSQAMGIDKNGLNVPMITAKRGSLMVRSQKEIGEMLSS